MKPFIASIINYAIAIVGSMICIPGVMLLAYASGISEILIGSLLTMIGLPLFIAFFCKIMKYDHKFNAWYLLLLLLCSIIFIGIMLWAENDYAKTTGMVLTLAGIVAALFTLVYPFIKE